MPTYEKARGYWRANFRAADGTRVTDVLYDPKGRRISDPGKRGDKLASAAEGFLRARKAAEADAEREAAAGEAEARRRLERSFGYLASEMLKTLREGDRENRTGHIQRLCRVPLTDPQEVVPSEDPEGRERDARPLIPPGMDVAEIDAAFVEVVLEGLRRRRRLVHLADPNGGQGRCALPGDRARMHAERRAQMRPRKNASKAPLRIPEAVTLSPASLRHHLVTISSVLTYAEGVRKVPLPRRPGQMPKVHGIERLSPRPVPPSDLIRILDNAAEHLRHGIVLTYSLGLRKFECWNLRRSMVDLDRWVVSLPGTMTKNGQPNAVPVHEDVKPLLRWLCERAASAGRQDLLVYKDAKTGTERPISDCRSAWRGACRRAGITYRFHDLKAAFTTDLLLHGVSAAVAQQLARHRDWRTTQRYVEFASEVRRSAVNALPLGGGLLHAAVPPEPPAAAPEAPREAAPAGRVSPRRPSST